MWQAVIETAIPGVDVSTPISPATRPPWVGRPGRRSSCGGPRACQSPTCARRNCQSAGRRLTPLFSTGAAVQRLGPMGLLLAIDTVATRHAAQRCWLMTAAARRWSRHGDRAGREAVSGARVAAGPHGAVCRPEPIIAVTTGPGSFTGAAHRFSAARGLGSHPIPVLGIPSLLALSLGARCEPLAVLLDAPARRGLFQAFSGPAIPIRPALLLMDGPGSACRRAPLSYLAAGRHPALARFAATADPAAIRPEASYVRDADAKPGENSRRRPGRCRMMRSWMAPLGLHIEPARPEDVDAVAKLPAQSFTGAGRARTLPPISPIAICRRWWCATRRGVSPALPCRASSATTSN